MKMLWISCLLIGSITCGPVWKGYGSDNAVPAATSFMRQPIPSSFGHWGHSGQGGSFLLPSLSYPSSGETLPAPQKPSKKSSSGSSVNLAGSSSSGLGSSRSLSAGAAAPSGSSDSIQYQGGTNSIPLVYEAQSYPASFDSYQGSSGLSFAQEGSANSGYGFSYEGNTHVDSGYASLKDKSYGSPEVSAYDVSYAGTGHVAYVAPQTSGYEGSDGGYVDSSYLGVAQGLYGGSLGEDGSSGAGTSYDVSGETSDGSLEPVFSDVSDLEPVYSFSSRSRYQRGRKMFAQTHYTPGEFLPPAMPKNEGISSSAVSAPRKSVQAPTKWLLKDSPGLI